MITDRPRRRATPPRSSRFVLAIALAFAAVSTHAAPGDLDPTFGTGGIVTTDILGASASANAALLQPDGKIVASGSTADGLALARFNPDGTLDPTFGLDGQVSTVVRLPFAAASAEAVAKAMVQLPDGSILVAGASTCCESPRGVLVSYRPDGTSRIDPEAELGSGDLLSVILQPDGKILVSGFSEPAEWPPALLLQRYSPDRSEVVVYRTETLLGPARESAFLLQPTGRIVGTVFRGVFGLVRVGPDGVLDSSFGGAGGVLTTRILETSDAMALAAQSDGKLIVAGQAGANPARFALARFTADGFIDPTFGTNGTVLTDFGVNTLLHALVVEPDGRMVAAGEEVPTNDGKRPNALLARYNPDGSLDPQFGTDGKLRTDLGGASRILDLLVQPDGKLVAAGSVTLADGTSKFALARYELGGHLPAGDEGACYTTASCLSRLVTALPPPGAAIPRRARLVAFQLSRLSARTGATLHTATAPNRKKLRATHARARHTLRMLLALARKADRGGTLGVPFAPIQATATRLLALLASEVPE